MIKLKKDNMSKLQMSINEYGFIISGNIAEKYWFTIPFKDLVIKHNSSLESPYLLIGLDGSTLALDIDDLNTVFSEYIKCTSK